MGIKRNGYPTKKSEYAITYSDMRGVDFSSGGENDHRYRFAYAENMYKDYESDGVGIVESIPGFRKISALGERIHAIYSQKDESGALYLIVHAKSSLYRVKPTDIYSSSNHTKIATVLDRKSSAFKSGKNLYLLDGRSIIKITPNGVAYTVSDSAEELARPYVPTLFVNGEEYEQRNLISSRFKEIFKIGAAECCSPETLGLKYKILSEEDLTCALSGVDATVSGEVRVPSETVIGEKKYAVKEIAYRSLAYNQKITRVVIAEGVELIAACAFIDSAAIAEVILPNSVKKIDTAAFVNCKALKTVQLGAFLNYISFTAFAGCDALEEIRYPLNEENFESITDYSNLNRELLVYSSHTPSTGIALFPKSPAVSINKVFVNGEESAFSTSQNGDFVREIILTGEKSSDFDGAEVEIFGTLSENYFTKSSHGKSFSEEFGDKISGSDAIRACTVCESFDGRIFISGNPSLPNTVFYTSRDLTGKNNPLYFGVMNYFNDGEGECPVSALLSAGDSLLVFKENDGTDGGIYCHTPRETGIDVIPKIYPLEFVHSGISSLGAATVFLDEPVFVSELGLCALTKKALNLEKSIAVRSHNVNPRLLSENLSSVSFTVWQGYLLLLAEGRIYLADPRMTFRHPSGEIEYEWFYLSGIGTYKYDTRVYRYASSAEEGYFVHSEVGRKTSGVVYSDITPSGSIHYVNENGKKYRVIPTEECTGGVFNPASAIHSPDKKLLYFGTQNGDICLFYNDKRIKEGEKKGKIDAKYYNFASHAPTYAVRTINDNLGIAYLTKRTVKKSLALKIKSFGEGLITVEAGTDRNGYSEIAEISDGSFDFGKLDFSLLSFKNSEAISVLISEKEKGWCEKAISVYTNEYSSPFGIYSISYRFTVDGKIKN